MEKYQKSKQKLDEHNKRFSVVQEIARQKGDKSIMNDFSKEAERLKTQYWSELMVYRGFQADNRIKLLGKKTVVKNGGRNVTTERFTPNKFKTEKRFMYKENRLGELIQVTQNGKPVFQNKVVIMNNSRDFAYNVKVAMASGVGLDSDKFKIAGVAISTQVTDNNHRFDADELRQSAGSLFDRPLLSDHTNSVNNIVGRVTSSVFDEEKGAILFEATVNKSEQGMRVRQLILDGDLNTVSVGANVQEIVEDGNDLVPKGIKFKELSLVASPADDNATFAKMSGFELALRESYYVNK